MIPYPPKEIVNITFKSDGGWLTYNDAHKGESKYITFTCMSEWVLKPVAIRNITIITTLSHPFTFGFFCNQQNKIVAKYEIRVSKVHNILQQNYLNQEHTKYMQALLLEGK